MGKARKPKPSQMATKNRLEEDIEQAKFAQPTNRNKVRPRKAEDEEFVESKTTNKILKLARDQQMEMHPTDALPSFQTKFDEPEESDTEPDDPNLKKHHEELENLQINEEDEEAINKFMISDSKPRLALADIIKGKLTEKKTELESDFGGDATPVVDLHPAVVKLCQGCAAVLKVFSSGKLPKFFNVIPRFQNWEQLLYITSPETWSAAAMYQVTRIMASNLDEARTERFYSLVLLPRIRDDLAEYKRLNFHLYQALRKALYKPKAFMKAIVLNLLESGDCTLREAIIIGSIIKKYPIPNIYSETATMSIAEMKYTGASSIFLRIFLEKQYSFLEQVIDSVCDHFMRFMTDEREMPVLWHQCLFTLVQRYKNALTASQKEGIRSLLRVHNHYQISPAIERELKH